MKALALTALIPCVILAACGRTEPPPSSPESNSAPPPAQNAPAPPAPAASTPPATPPPTQATNTTSTGAFAALAGTGTNPSGGRLQLVALTNGVKITGEITGLAPKTTHGFHIHQTGDCSAPDFTSAGDHFNPDGAKHGAPTSAAHHLGDITSIKSNSKGIAMIDTTIARATLNDGGPHDLVGKAFILHARPDDYKTQPSGNSGARIACGVIERLQ